MSSFSQKFKNIKLTDLSKEASARKKDEWRFVQILATKTDKGTDLIYSFMKDGLLENLKVKNVKDKDVVPSVSKEFVEAFVFENEIHDLFNINIKDIVIDFKGKFYNVAVDAPMTIVSPEVLARKEKQAKIEAALAAKKAATKKTDKKPEGKGE